MSLISFKLLCIVIACALIGARQSLQSQWRLDYPEDWPKRKEPK